ncbi:hypothetical protein GCM10025862_18600 [Arsenicicoccus piscis]|uniref:Glutaminase n=1 Tax=Arsenicicoccus piscis TaxID=673954 RepID=A0ABQ6HN17_9MICO|nr:hypothetical protein GCM10025862_18600 [Arsenicicoccus piscis]
MDKLVRAFDLQQPLRERIAAGMPVYGSCAGLILLADRLVDAHRAQQTLGGLDVLVRRNAFGRQVDSFEADLRVEGSTASRCAPSSSGHRGSSRWARRSRSWPRSRPPTARRTDSRTPWRSGRGRCWRRRSILR